jgi:hypothetical protein
MRVLVTGIYLVLVKSAGSRHRRQHFSICSERQRHRHDMANHRDHEKQHDVIIVTAVDTRVFVARFSLGSIDVTKDMDLGHVI